jgi:uncharacterized membrane protein YcaP (DUF421 family)
MDGVIQTVAIYFFLLLVFRISGKRSLQDVTLFDFVLLLVISESVQEALVGDDFSIIKALIVISTFLILDIGMSLLKQRFPALSRTLDGMSLLIVKDGKPLKDRMDKERIDEDDILEAAREKHGLSRLDQVKYAVLERNGSISIIPKRGAQPAA